jgi:predicted CXXCH cytochrome family protein
VPVAIVAAFFVFAAGGFFTAAGMEENDSFCTSCHTQPETTYVARAQGGSPVDLASSHHYKDSPVKCIDCHSEPGLMGRVSAVSLGAQDAIKFVTHTAQQPAPLTMPIPDSTCLNCHQDTPNARSFDQHFHRFLARWQGVDPQAATCVTCHTAHTTDGDATIGFLQQQHTEQICQRCHEALGARG